MSEASVISKKIVKVLFLRSNDQFTWEFIKDNLLKVNQEGWKEHWLMEIL